MTARRVRPVRDMAADGAVGTTSGGTTPEVAPNAASLCTVIALPARSGPVRVRPLPAECQEKVMPIKAIVRSAHVAGGAAEGAPLSGDPVQ
ncbi:hypothetical protein GCM10010513_52120 [Streptomyces glebosus]|nr:hypothetical protein GCM10010513_52120 [Streptomyces glebosus]